MKPFMKNLTCTTAIAVGLAASQGAAFAQPFDELSGVMVPACGANAQEADAGTLEAEAFGKNNKLITVEMVLDASERGEICINGKGKLKLRGESAAMNGMEAEAEDLEETAATDTATATAETAAVAETSTTLDTATTTETTAIAETVTAAETTATAETTTTPETTATADSATTAEVTTQDNAATAEATTQESATATTQQPAAEQPASGMSAEDLAKKLVQSPEASTEQPADVVKAPDAPVANEQAQTAETPQPNPETVTTQAVVQAEAEAPVAAAAAAEANSEAADVQEMVVTEENSRSSSEEFQTTVELNTTASATAAPEKEKGGLSNFEKFALGAAGIVALDAILGNNREVVSNSGDRVVTRDTNGNLEVLRDDDILLRRPGSEVRTETFSDGSTRTTVTRQNGSQIVTIADASGRVLKRSRVTPDGRTILLIDDMTEVQPVDVSRLPTPQPENNFIQSSDRESLQAALRANSTSQIDRRYTLRQVRQYREVRDLMPEINIDAINFRTGSAAIEQQEAEALLSLGEALSEYIAQNPGELFLVEGHTDAVGDAAYNLALSDRRAESVALALTEYFDVPPENMIIQGYGESDLVVQTSEAERANRRAVVRRVTPLLR